MPVVIMAGKGQGGGHTENDQGVRAHRVLLMDLGEQRAADEPRADEADCQRQRGQVEAAVHRAQRALRILLVDQHRDVVLAAPLRDRPARARRSRVTHLGFIIQGFSLSTRCTPAQSTCACPPQLSHASGVY